jgi:hypothetical protein
MVSPVDLEGQEGVQHYTVPAGADRTRYYTCAWCQRQNQGTKRKEEKEYRDFTVKE